MKDLIKIFPFNLLKEVFGEEATNVYIETSKSKDREAINVIAEII